MNQKKMDEELVNRSVVLLAGAFLFSFVASFCQGLTMCLLRFYPSKEDCLCLSWISNEQRQLLPCGLSSSQSKIFLLRRSHPKRLTTIS